MKKIVCKTGGPVCKFLKNWGGGAGRAPPGPYGWYAYAFIVSMYVYYKLIMFSQQEDSVLDANSVTSAAGVATFPTSVAQRTGTCTAAHRLRHSDTGLRQCQSRCPQTSARQFSTLATQATVHPSVTLLLLLLASHSAYSEAPSVTCTSGVPIHAALVMSGER